MQEVKKWMNRQIKGELRLTYLVNNNKNLFTIILSRVTFISITVLNGVIECMLCKVKNEDCKNLVSIVKCAFMAWNVHGFK